MDGNFAAVEGLSVFYVEAGEGIPVLYIHGNTGSSRYFSKVMRIRGCRTIALDMPNFGKSSSMPDEPSIEAYAKWVYKFIEVMKLKRPLVVGHSLGGAVAQVIAVDHPDSVRALALVDSASPRGLITPKDRYPFIELMYKDKNVLSQALAATMPTLNDKELFASILDEATAMAKPAWLGNAEALSNFEISSKCASYKNPVLVLWGRKDFLVTEQMARETAAAYPNSSFRILENVGHSGVVEDPEQFISIFENFVSGLKE